MFCGDLNGKEIERKKKEIYVYKGFPGGSDGKDSACNKGDLGSNPELGRLTEAAEHARTHMLLFSGWVVSHIVVYMLTPNT